MGAESVRYETADDASSPDAGLVREGLRDYNSRFAPNDDHRPLSVYARDGSGAVIGGLLGGTYWGWLYVDILWVSGPERDRGVGKKLLGLAEDEARARGCANAHLYTHDFQARGFYEKMGYSVRASLDGLPPGHAKYLLTKVL